MGLLRKFFGSASQTAPTVQARALRQEPAGPGQRGQALARVATALEASPDDPQLWFEQAEILFAWGRYREAQEAYVRAGTSGQRGAQFDVALGRACLHNGHVAEGEAQMRKAIAAEPTWAVAHYELAMALRAQQQVTAAMASFERAAQIDPTHYETLLELGNCKVELGDTPAGEALFRRAIEVDGERAVGWQNLGVALRNQDRHAEAQDAFERAEKLQARNGGEHDGFVNLALAYKDADRLADALTVFERWLPQRPSPYGHNAYAEMLFSAGRLVEGWDHFEFRWLNEPLLSHRVRAPRSAWAGQELSGEVIRLRIEQGFGDLFLFIRYARLLKALGATVQVPRFADVAGDFAGIDHVVVSGTPPREYDHHVNILSLPRIFGTTLASIPATVPYLSVNPEKLAQWAPRLATDSRALKVGLVWSGNPAQLNDRNRSMSLRTLAPLAEVAGVRWYSLQRGAKEEEASAPPPGFDWTNLGPDLAGWSDTAAVISLLDLVICVDTAVAHLAGALGRPVWTLISRPYDWHYLEAGDSPWYPTMRVFRQSERGNWPEVVERVKVALRSAASDISDALAPAASTVRATPRIAPAVLPPSKVAGRRAGLSAVTETRHGILQYLPDERWIGDSIGWYGEYLEPQLGMLARMMRPGATVLEMGAGVGAHALFLAAAVGPAGHLILSEPRSVHHQILRQNLAANRIANATLLNNAAGADSTADSVDDLRLAQLEWLKLADGCVPLATLEGAVETLWRLRPMVFVAAQDEAALASIAVALKACGYRAWRMSTPLFDRGNFNRRDDDIFAGRTALAVLALPEEIEVNMAIDGCVELS